MIIKLKKIWYDLFDSGLEAFLLIFSILYFFSLSILDKFNNLYILFIFVDYIIWFIFIYNETTQNKINIYRKFLIPIIWFSLLVLVYLYTGNNVYFNFLLIVLVGFVDQIIKNVFSSKKLNLITILSFNFFANSILVIGSVTIVLLCCSVLFMSNYIFVICIVITMCLIIMLLILALILMLSSFSLNDENTFKINFVHHNLDINEIMQGLYFSNMYDKKRKNYNIIKIDLANLFEAVGGTLENFVIKNKFCTNKRSLTLKRNYFYLYVTNFTKNCKIIMDVKIKNKKNIEKNYKIRLDISFVNLESLAIVEEYKVSILRRYLFARDFYEKKELILGDYNKLFLAYNTIYINENEEYKKIKVALNEEAICARKWIEHKDDFGNGKTLLDKIIVNSLGYSAVVVSSWESGYDEDFIRAIYNKLSDNRGIVHVMQWTIIAAFLLPIISELISKISILIYQNYEILDENSLFLIITLLLLVIVVIICINFRLDIILFKKDGTKLFEEAYIKYIRRKLIENNIMLIVEDVDRLSEEKVNHVFSKLSLLNNSINLNRQLGIISYSIDELFNNRENNGELNKKYREIKEKIISNSIDTKADTSINKIGYVKINNNYLKEYYKKSLSNQITITKSFRDIKTDIFNYLSSND